MLTSVLLVSLLAGSSYAIVCTPSICEGVEQKELDCAGDLIEKGGFCGCTDVCAGVEGDDCHLDNKKSIPLLGVTRSTPCSTGFRCVERSFTNALGFLPLGASTGVCQKIEPTTTTPRPLSKCEQTRRVRMISFAIWKGQWTPKCFSDGRFQPKQCDNTGACFCVTPVEGTVLLGTKKQSYDVQC